MAEGAALVAPLVPSAAMLWNHMEEQPVCCDVGQEVSTRDQAASTNIAYWNFNWNTNSGSAIRVQIRQRVIQDLHVDLHECQALDQSLINTGSFKDKFSG